MGRYHKGYLANVFPKQNATGLDLGNIELKRFNVRGETTLKPEDKRAELLIFLDSITDDFYLVSQDMIAPIEKRRTYRLKQAKRVTKGINDIFELYERIYPILNDKTYIPDDYREFVIPEKEEVIA